MNTKLNENITGMLTVQLFGRENRNGVDFDRSNRRLLGANLRSVSWFALFQPSVSILGSVAKTGHLFTVEENPRLLGWGAEIASIVADEAFWDLDGPIVRITTPHIPLPAADHLEDLALPNAARIVEKIARVMKS